MTSLTIADTVATDTTPAAATGTNSTAAPIARALFANNASDTLTTAATSAVITPAAQATTPE